jgi:dsDNA-specific endonuclease/ATPase MutS2
LPGVEAAVEAVTELDAIKAKVEFARKFRAIVPKISDDDTLELIDAATLYWKKTCEPPRCKDAENQRRKHDR